jgi:hypothetical protein
VLPPPDELPPQAAVTSRTPASAPTTFIVVGKRRLDETRRPGAPNGRTKYDWIMSGSRFATYL